MVTLIVSEIEQISMLEDLLRQAHSEFKIKLQRDNLMLETPYLLVDSVPLDLAASITYLTERLEANNE